MEAILKRTISTLLVLLTFYGYGQAGLRGNKLAHSHYIHFGVRQVTLDFIDNRTCILTQSVQMALPSGPVIIKDTLRYHIDDNSRISFTNLNKNAPYKVQKHRCEDYSALCYKPTIFVSRNGQQLEEYSLTAEKITWLYKHTFLIESSSFIYTLPKQFKGCYSEEEHYMVLSFGEREGIGFFYQIPADVEKVGWRAFYSASGRYDMLREDWGFCWFSRPRHIPVVTVTSEIIGHQFVYMQDTLSFLGNGNCVEYRHSSGSYVTRTYSIDGAYIILNHPVPTKQAPDTLLYKGNIIYNAIVCQTTDSIELHQGIGPYYGTPYPTGTLLVLAYEDISMPASPDSIIGRTFQRYYMPINFRPINQ